MSETLAPFFGAPTRMFVMSPNEFQYSCGSEPFNTLFTFLAGFRVHTTSWNFASRARMGSAFVCWLREQSPLRYLQNPLPTATPYTKFPHSRGRSFPASPATLLGSCSLQFPPGSRTTRKGFALSPRSLSIIISATIPTVFSCNHAEMENSRHSVSAIRKPAVYLCSIEKEVNHLEKQKRIKTSRVPLVTIRYKTKKNQISFASRFMSSTNKTPFGTRPSAPAAATRLTLSTATGGVSIASKGPTLRNLEKGARLNSCNTSNAVGRRQVDPRSTRNRSKRRNQQWGGGEADISGRVQTS